jgi:hypothetical protein
MTEQPSALEVRLRSTLVELRPPHGAPHLLRARVAVIPETQARTWWRTPARVFARAVALAALVAVVIALSALRPTLGPVAPGGPGAAPPAAFDPMIEGPGILRYEVRTLVLVPLVAALGVALVGGRWALRRRGQALVIRVAIVAVLAGAIASPALQPGFEMGSAYGPMVGYDLHADPPPGADYPTVWYETAEPGGPLALVLTVRNPGPLPIRLDGLVETQTAATPLIQRWTALWLGTDRNTIGNPLDELVPFTPTTVEPQQELQVYLVGRAGLCAFGPGYTLASPLTGHSSRGRTIEFAYSVLGLGSTAPFELPMSLVEPYRENCPAS